LAAAQHEIATNWYAAWIAAGRPMPQDFGYSTGPAPAAGPSSQPPSAAAWCTATTYSSSYGDYDVYVHSNQPNKSATATASNGKSHSRYTNASGYADIYLHADPGNSITVTVGAASCSTTA